MKIIKIMRKLYWKLPVLLFDISAIPFAWFAAFMLRYNLHPFTATLTSTYSALALALLTIVQVACFYYFKTYRGLWRFFSLNDVLRILRSVLASNIVLIPLFYSMTILQHLPRSIFPLYDIILVTILCSGRLIKRLYGDNLGKQYPAGGKKRVLIVGAGKSGEGLVRELRRSNEYLPIGFVDDNLAKRGLEVHGVRVLGATSKLPDYVQQFDIELIFIAIPSANSAVMRRIVTQCESTNVAFRTLPSISALASGRVEINSLRPVNLEDLLGRDQVRLEWDKIATTLKGKRILVTGGGGSIGSELLRQIMSLKPSIVAIVENCEYNLYKIEQELSEKYSDILITPRLMSITDEVGIENLFDYFQPEIVFHAAAFKHVPMLQNQIRAAVYNNIVGTQIVAKASVKAAVQKFILISTDKAVNPTNIMGITKRVAEIYCQNLNTRVNTQFITVRFGNVLGSAGSVVPLFQKQLQQGGPLTVTHPDMQRYFMTIPEACQLILQAMANGQGGEIFVLDMGEPIKISYLAEQMILLAGKEPGKDIKIEYTGLRPGEKLYEELFHESEELVPTAHEKLFKAKFRELNWNDLSQTLRMIDAACSEHQDEELVVLVQSLVPESTMFTPYAMITEAETDLET